jgi:hypothetical protein
MRPDKKDRPSPGYRMQARLESASGILLNHVFQVSFKDARPPDKHPQIAHSADGRSLGILVF